MSVCSEPRYLCAELVQLRFPDGNGKIVETAANLEEISRHSATLLCNVPVRPATNVMIRCGDAELSGSICHSARVKCLGYYTGVTFIDEWSPPRFQPRHMIPIRPSRPHAACSCCTAACPALPARGQHPGFSTRGLQETAHAVARNCPHLGESDLETCYARLFGGAQNTRGLNAFRRSYREACTLKAKARHA